TAQGDAQRKQSEELWGAVAKWAAAAAAAVTAFGVASVKAFMEADKVQKQLTRAAGEYGEALSEQASALQELYAVDDDIIKQSQTLLVQWGGVGAASEEVTKAVLDYAAATGQDAVAATQDLIRNVESGGAGLAKMGVHFTATGDKGKDLTAAVGALSKKFGGAAEADKNSLHGQLEAVGLAFSDLQEDIGGMIASFNTQYDITGKLTEALRGMQTLLGGGSENAAEAKRQERLKVEEQLTGRLEQRKALEGQINAARKMGAEEDIARLETIYRKNEAAITQLKKWRDEMNGVTAGGPLAGAPGVTGQTNKSMKDAESEAEAHAKKMETVLKKNKDDWREYLKGIDDLDEHARQRDQLQYAEELAGTAKALDDRVALHKKAQKELEEIRVDEEKKAAEHAEKLVKIQKAETEKATKEAAERTKKQEQEAKQAADQIGAAFVNALADQLAKLADGGEFDVAIFVGEIIASAVAIAGTVIGSAYGQPALGAALGNLAGMGVRAGASAISNGRKAKPKKYHSGGWVGDEIDIPTYHSGGWVGVGRDEELALLRKDERVLTPEEVGNMGGRSAVDAAAKGGGRPAVIVNLSAIDSKSAADSFVSDLGDGLRDALRTGRGALAPLLLGANPR
ncbi:MAG TPA: hypothetical protein VGD87_05835, partial [Archangium sp.]